MNIFAWIWDQFSLDHIYQCTHCGKENAKVTEVSWFYAAYAPSIKYPLKRRSIHDNWLCEDCMNICFQTYRDPSGIITELLLKVAPKGKKKKASIKGEPNAIESA